jgi:hypothetical protein
MKEVLAILLFAPSLLLAQGRGGKGQGAIVLRDDAPVYAHSKGDEVEWKMKRGDAVAGITSDLKTKWLFDEVDGRLHCMYFRGEQKGLSRSGWMDPKDLSRFTYDGSCQSSGSPLTTKGFSTRWNACFEEGRDNKLDLLKVVWAAQQATPVPALSPTAIASPDPTLTPTPK